MRAGVFGSVIVLAAAVAVAGCATPGSYRDPKDPLEPYNRAMFRFNTDFDNAFVKPVAKGYKYITPEPVDRSVTNFFNNIDDITSAVNNLLQFKLSRFGTDVGRVAVNSTVGLLGVLDVATNLGLPSYKEDFGQTLGYWGIGTWALLRPTHPGAEHHPRHRRLGRRHLRRSLLQREQERDLLGGHRPAGGRPARRSPEVDGHPRGGGHGPLHLPARRLSAASPVQGL